MNLRQRLPRPQSTPVPDALISVRKRPRLASTNMLEVSGVVETTAASGVTNDGKYNTEGRTAPCSFTSEPNVLKLKMTNAERQRAWRARRSESAIRKTKAADRERKKWFRCAEDAEVTDKRRQLNLISQRKAREAKRIKLRRKPDVTTMISKEIWKSWQDDTSAITKPVLEGEGECGGRPIIFNRL